MGIRFEILLLSLILAISAPVTAYFFAGLVSRIINSNSGTAKGIEKDFPKIADPFGLLTKNVIASLMATFTWCLPIIVVACILGWTMKDPEDVASVLAGCFISIISTFVLMSVRVRAANSS